MDTGGSAGAKRVTIERADAKAIRITEDHRAGDNIESGCRGDTESGGP